jgi:SDR family mycofactocin-dependent oxidoreductase
MSRFEGKTVFITGAARGQGRSHALGFAREGADVVAVDIADQIDGLEYPLADPVDLEETAAAVGEIGAECLTVQADVRDRAAIADAVEQAVSRFGGIDIVIANAGICTYGSLVDQDHHDWDITVGTNLTGVWNTLKPAVPHLIERGHGGRVVVTASSLVRHPQPNIVAYTAAKFGLIGIVKGLSRELIEHGITVNAVNPGIVNTTMGLNEGAYKLFVPGKPNPTREDAEEVMVMIGANGDPYVEPQDITDGVLFLASPEAQKISGMQLDVSGGMNAATAG